MGSHGIRKGEIVAVKFRLRQEYKHWRIHSPHFLMRVAKMRSVCERGGGQETQTDADAQVMNGAVILPMPVDKDETN